MSGFNAPISFTHDPGSNVYKIELSPGFVDSDLIIGRTCDGSSNRVDSLYRAKELTEGKNENKWVTPGKEYQRKIRRPPESVEFIKGDELCLVGYAWLSQSKNPFYSWGTYVDQPVEINGGKYAQVRIPGGNRAMQFTDILRSSSLPLKFWNRWNKPWNIHESSGSDSTSLMLNQNHFFKRTEKGNFFFLFF